MALQRGRLRAQRDRDTKTVKPKLSNTTPNGDGGHGHGSAPPTAPETGPVRSRTPGPISANSAKVGSGFAEPPSPGEAHWRWKFGLAPSRCSTDEESWSASIAKRMLSFSSSPSLLPRACFVVVCCLLCCHARELRRFRCPFQGGRQGNGSPYFRSCNHFILCVFFVFANVFVFVGLMAETDPISAVMDLVLHEIEVESVLYGSALDYFLVRRTIVQSAVLRVRDLERSGS